MKTEICAQRMLSRFRVLSSIGQTDRGVCREAFSPAWKEAAQRLCRMMEEEGLAAHIDPVGNVYGRLPGACKDRSPVLLGSHLDTVTDGGLYDGAFGVAAALEVACAIKHSGQRMERDIEIVAFNAEEGGPLGGTFGSRAAAGNQATEGKEEALSACGLSAGAVRAAKLSRAPKCYLELHIEQGSQLFEAGERLGIVEGIVGIVRFELSVLGQANHAGTTPMQARRDALLGAARLIAFIHEKAAQKEAPFVATVGKLSVFPNAVNVIPGRVDMILEMRDMEPVSIEAFLHEVQQEAQAMQGFIVEFRPYGGKEGVRLSSAIADRAEKLCRAGGISFRRMYSGAGHDAMEMAKIAEAGLLFIPSRDGISHSREEFSSEEDMLLGAQLLLELALQSAQEP